MGAYILAAVARVGRMPQARARKQCRIGGMRRLLIERMEANMTCYCNVYPNNSNQDSQVIASYILEQERPHDTIPVLCPRTPAP